MDRELLISRLRTVLETSALELVFAYLFGSFARGDQKDSSDVDLAVYYREPPRPSLNSPPACLEADLVRELGREVQVIDLHRAPPDLVFRILRDKVVLLDRDKSLRIRFEVRARNEFWDLEPILDIVRKKKRSSA